MTGSEWLNCRDPWLMLEFLKSRASRRKFLLVGVACCRRARCLSDDRRLHRVIEVAEQCAVGWSEGSDLEAAMEPVSSMWGELPSRLDGPWSPSTFMTAAVRHVSGNGAGYAASFAARGLATLVDVEGSDRWSVAVSQEQAVQCELIRDVFGDPSRPFGFDPEWLRTDGVAAASLARRIDEIGCFEELPALVRCLEQAGCRDRSVIEHCLGPGPHVRGCWVIDALLGREPSVARGLLTERDWRDCDRPETLLHFLADKGTDRDWRRFALSCCRRIDHLIEDARSRAAIEVATRYAEGLASPSDLDEAHRAAREAAEEARHAVWTAEAEEGFCITPRYALTSLKLFAARAALGSVKLDPRRTDDPEGSYEATTCKPSHQWVLAVIARDVFVRIAAIAGAWSSSPVQDAIHAAEVIELRAQCDNLRSLFADHLGPPGDGGAWLPRGEVTAEWWCLLPTPRPRA